jgi:hypothetical protein
MLRFLLKLGLFLPIPIGMALVNWHVDPAKLYAGHASDPRVVCVRKVPGP